MKKKIGIILSSIFLLVSCEKEKKEVNIYMWGGSKDVNRFMDEVVTPKVLEKEEIVLNRVPIVDIKDVVNKLVIEKQAGKKDGVVDILWVNGENFKTLKEADVLEENILTRIGNRNILKESTTERDFGEPIDNLEVPFGEAQFNLIYNSSANKEKPFVDYKTLEEYVKKNPNRFTYPTVTSFLGSAFVRNIAIDILGLENIQKMNQIELENNLNIVWEYLNNIKPYLWREGKTYPESEGKLDLLYSSGEIDVNMGYTINKVDLKVNSGEFSNTSKSFLLDRGTLFNNHYLAIPNNSTKKNEALKVINILVSPKVQALKQSPSYWGDFTVLDLNKISKDDMKEFEQIKMSENIPTSKELEEKRVQELSPEQLKIIDNGWIEKVGKN